MEKKYEIQTQEEEISLVDLFITLYKHKLFIIVTTVIISLVGLGGAFYVRSNIKNKTSIDYKIVNRIDGFYTSKAKLHIKYIDEQNMFNNSRILNNIFKEELVIKLFKESKLEDTELNRREFLSKLIEQKKIMSDDAQPRFLYYTLSIEEQKIGNEKIDVKQILEKFIHSVDGLYNSQYVDAINEKLEETKEKKELYEKELEKISLEVKKVVSEQPVELLANEKAIDIIKLKYPKLFNKEKEVNELYLKYNGELIGVEGVKSDRNLDTRVEKVSSYYEVKTKSKAKIIVLGGIILGLILGVLGAFTLEFWNVLKEDIKKK